MIIIFRHLFGFLLVFLIFFHTQASAQCQAKRINIQVLGSGGPELNDGRASTSYLIWLDNKGVVLIDAGAGSSLNYEKTAARLNDLQVMAFSHFHVDHSADFAAYVKAFYFSRREMPLIVLGPDGNKLMPSAVEFSNRFFSANGVYPYLQEYLQQNHPQFSIQPKNVSLKPRKPQQVYQSKQFFLTAIPVHHGPIPALAWRFDAAGCKISFSGDLSNRYQTLAMLAEDSDLLIAHNAVPESEKGAGRHLHMPPSEIGDVAALAGVKALVLSHRMQRTLGKEKQTLAQIRKKYSAAVLFANDLDQFKLDGLQ